MNNKVFFLACASMLTVFAPPTSMAADQHECLVEPAVVLVLSSPVAGVIQSIGVGRGDRVWRGQTLVKLHAGSEQAAVELAQAKLEFSAREVKRAEELFRENFTSEYSVDEATTTAKLAEVELKQAEAILAQKTLTSPISGVVVQRLAQVGESVGNDEILRLAQINPLHIEVVLPVDQLNTVTEGMGATIYPQAPFGGEYSAKVQTVDNVIDAASGTFGVRLKLKNPGNKIPAGLRCKVSFNPE
ncbi:MAG: membrane fusion protein (multidrug efflux system) [Cryomorphaceae bacterium]|jgi:membrane fusion protein (multidrug efflux system)